MRRAPYVIAGTFVGVAGVLAYPTHRPHLALPSQSASSTGTTATTAPPNTATAPPSGATAPAGQAASSAPPATAAPSTAARQATGADTPYPYGDLAVEVKVTGTHITSLVLTRLNDGGSGTSSYIDHQAVPLLRQQVLAAQSTNINGVSGATYTSQAYVDSVQSALDKLGVK